MHDKETKCYTIKTFIILVSKSTENKCLYAIKHYNALQWKLQQSEQAISS